MKNEQPVTESSLFDSFGLYFFRLSEETDRFCSRLYYTLASENRRYRLLVHNINLKL